MLSRQYTLAIKKRMGCLDSDLMKDLTVCDADWKWAFLTKVIQALAHGGSYDVCSPHCKFVEGLYHDH